jgi:hypothetical protein
MSDEPFYTPNKRPASNRQPSAGRFQWALVKAGRRRLICELRNNTKVAAGVELQLLTDGELLAGKRYATMAIAEDAALAFRASYVARGWVSASALPLATANRASTSD